MTQRVHGADLFEPGGPANQRAAEPRSPLGVRRDDHVRIRPAQRGFRGAGQRRVGNGTIIAPQPEVAP